MARAERAWELAEELRDTRSKIRRGRATTHLGEHREPLQSTSQCTMTLETLRRTNYTEGYLQAGNCG